MSWLRVSHQHVAGVRLLAHGAVCRAARDLAKNLGNSNRLDPVEKFSVSRWPRHGGSWSGPRGLDECVANS